MADNAVLSLYSGCVRLDPPVTDEALAELANGSWRLAYEGHDSSTMQGVEITEDGLTLIVSTASAWRCSLARAVAGLLAQRLGNVTGGVVDDMELALHEAICNAVFHGNLDMDETTRVTPAAMDFYHQHAQERLADPRLAARRVIIRASWTEDDITLTIQDEGTGEGLQRLRAKSCDPCYASQRLGGHGLRLMQSLTQALVIDPARRRVILVFSRLGAQIDQDTQRVTHRLVSTSDGLVSQEDLDACHIVVVDDVAANVQMIGRFLREAGWSRITHARDGEQALALLGAGPVDLVLLDVAMPGIDGFEVCRRIRQDMHLVDLPVVMQTAFTGMRERQQAFACGATDYVTKPLDYTELTARLRVHLAKRLLIRTLRAYHDRLARDLDLARAMQCEALPSSSQIQAIGEVLPVQVQGVYQPCSELAGDVWGVEALPGGLCSLFLADVSGHGVGAAINAFRLQTLIRLESATIRRDPARMLDSLNRQLADMLHPGQFVAMFYGVVDTAAHTLHWSAAGMPDPVLRISSSVPTRTLDASGVPLGMRPHSQYHSQTTAFPPGSYLLLYSDALLETGTKTGDYPTAAMVAQWLDRQDPFATPQAVLDALLGHSLLGGAHLTPQDDLTMVCLRHE